MEVPIGYQSLLGCLTTKCLLAETYLWLMLPVATRCNDILADSCAEKCAHRSTLGPDSVITFSDGSPKFVTAGHGLQLMWGQPLELAPPFVWSEESMGPGRALDPAVLNVDLPGLRALWSCHELTTTTTTTTTAAPACAHVDGATPNTVCTCGVEHCTDANPYCNGAACMAAPACLHTDGKQKSSTA